MIKIDKKRLLKGSTAMIIALAIVFIGGVLAFQIITFDSNISSFNIIYSGVGNTSMNVTLYKNANVTGAYVNLSANYLTNQTGNDSVYSYSYTNISTAVDSPENFTDNDSSTFTLAHNQSNSEVVSVVYYINYTLPQIINITGNTSNCFRDDACGALLNIKLDSNPQSGNFYYNELKLECKGNNNWETITDSGARRSDGWENMFWSTEGGSLYNPKGQNGSYLSPTGANGCYLWKYEGGSWANQIKCDGNSYFPIMPNCTISNKLQLRVNITLLNNQFYPTTTDFNTQLHYTKIWFIEKNTTTNPYITLNSTTIWNFTGTFNQTNNRTSNFASTINTALHNGLCDCKNCTLIGNNCTIPITFFSNSSGILQVSDLNITWLEYTKPNLTISHPNQTYSGITYIPLNFTAIDDWELGTCYFNVTRGASLEVANTNIANCQNTTFTVSGDANYVLHMCINDTSGNSICNSSSFDITSYIPPPVVPPSPGGGGGSPFNLQDILNKTTTMTKATLCLPGLPKLQTAWDNFKVNMNWANFVILWHSYWNYALCRSAASIVPI